MAKAAHSRQLAAYLYKVEGSLRRRISAHLLNDAGNVLACRHTNHLVRGHSKVSFYAGEHPRHVLDAQMNEFFSVVGDVG